MKIDGKFHDFCEGCQFIVLDGKMIPDVSGVDRAWYTCDNYDLCARLWERLSTIKEAENERL